MPLMRGGCRGPPLRNSINTLFVYWVMMLEKDKKITCGQYLTSEEVADFMVGLSSKEAMLGAAVKG